jgi:predicted CxxxxCH...CXXCH cytochrome family protein
MGALNLTSSSILYNMTANRTPVQNDTVKTHGFGCANCHPMNAANHLNGTIDVDMSAKGLNGLSKLRFLNSTTLTNLPSYTGGKCNNIYCHSNASRVASENVYKQSPTWVGGSFTGDRCAGCHDNQPATGAHAAHAVGNHTDNIYNGKSGKVATSNRANTAHGNPNNSTTIGCYICHNATVTSKANDNNTKCAVCHFSGNTVGAQLKGAATIANLANHVNGSREIQFLPIQVKSKAQIRPESFKFYSGVWQRSTYKNMSTLSYDVAKNALDTATMWHPSTPMASNCTNIACHNGKTVSWNLANWNDPNKCMDCHNQL